MLVERVPEVLLRFGEQKPSGAIYISNVRYSLQCQ